MREGVFDPDRQRLAEAYRTLIRGSGAVCTAVRSGDPGRAMQGDPLTVKTRIRFVGNGLRELDRFLNVLTNEAALHLAPPDHDPSAFGRLRNTPNKLREVRGMMDLGSPDHEPLRVVGHVRDCLVHCGGAVHGARVSLRLLPAAGLFGIDAAAAHGPETLAVTPAALGRIGLLYRRTADDLLGELALRRPVDIDFTGRSPHIRRANVACDGM